MRALSRRHADRARVRLRRVAFACWGVTALVSVALARPPANASHRAREGAPLAAPSEPAGTAGTVLAVRLEGPVTPVMAEALDRALTRAERERRPALVVELDTPGGLESSMRDMVKRMLGAGVPVVVWITPGGARAASAGVCS